MPAIAKSKYLNEWQTVLSGDGAISYQNNNTRANVSAGVGGRSYIKQRVPARPGDKITLKCLGRVISGTPALSIDYPATGQQKNEITMSGAAWQEYELNYEVPYTAEVESDYVQCTVGVFTSDSGDADIILPSVSVEPNQNGYMRTYAAGLIRVQKSGASIVTDVNENFAKCGIKSVGYSAGTLTVECDAMNTAADEFMRPLFFVSRTGESNPDITLTVGEFSPGSGNVLVKFGNGTGSFVDLNSVMADTELFYIWFEARGY